MKRKKKLRDGGTGGKKLMWGDDVASLCVCEREREGARKWCSPCSSLSAWRSRWLSRVEGTVGPQGALGTPSALHRARSPPSQHSPNTQASAIKTTPNKHTPNTLTTCGGGGWGGGEGRGHRHSRAVVNCVCCQSLVLLCHIRQRWKIYQTILLKFCFHLKVHNSYAMLSYADICLVIILKYGNLKYKTLTPTA